MLYVLGLSYGATSLALEALGVCTCKTSVYEAVQAAAKKVLDMKRQEVFAGVQTLGLGGDLTSVKCHGEWLPLGLVVADTTDLVLNVDALPAEDPERVKRWLEPVVKAVDARLLVSDDADVFKSVASDFGLAHQGCKGHVKRNTEAFIESLEPKVASDEDGSLAAIEVTPEQALRDLHRLGELIPSHQPEEENELAWYGKPPGAGRGGSCPPGRIGAQATT